MSCDGLVSATSLRKSLTRYLLLWSLFSWAADLRETLAWAARCEQGAPELLEAKTVPLSLSKVGPKCGPSQCPIYPWSISLLSFCKMQLFRGVLLVSSQSFIGFDLYMLLFLHIFPLVNCLARLLSPVLTVTQLKAVSSVYAIAWRLDCPENSLLDSFSLPPLRHGQNIDKFFAMIRHKWPHVQFQESPHFYSEEAWWVISTTKFWLPTRIKLSL